MTGHTQAAREMLAPLAYAFGPEEWASHPVIAAVAALLAREEHHAAQARMMAEAHQELCDMVPAQGHETVNECVARLVAREAQMRAALTLAANRLDRLTLITPQASALRYEAIEWTQEARAALAPIAADAQPAPVAKPVAREELVALPVVALSSCGDKLCTLEGAVRAITSARTAARRKALEEAKRACLSLWDLRDDERARMYAAKCADAIAALPDAQG